MNAVVEGLPALLHGAQRAWLHALDALGLAGRIEGQPAWPFAHRVAVETLSIDPALTRQLLWGLLALMALAGLLVLAWRRRRARPLSLALCGGIALATPWPAPALLWTDAVPTSFHRNPHPFHVTTIARGLQIYEAQCASCHGTDGRGDTPRAATLPVWPPRLTGGLMWKRAEGELYGRVRSGVHGSDGRTTMQADQNALTPDDTWAVMDAMKVLAAADSLRTAGRWAWPLRAPDFAIDCDGRPLALSDWRGRRVRIAGAAGAAAREDARFERVVLGPTGDDCAAPAEAARRVFTLLSGTDRGDEAEFIVDREGWLRAVGRVGTEWDADDLLCRSDSPGRDQGGGLDELIRRMDADPVRVAVGVPHARAR